MILPYIEISNVMIICCNQREKIKLQRVPNKGLKLALGRDKYFATKLLQRETGLAAWATRARVL